MISLVVGTEPQIISPSYRFQVNVLMDATAKPLRIPPQMGIYAEKHEIFDLVQVQYCKVMK